jgi:hypothetical protein
VTRRTPERCFHRSFRHELSRLLRRVIIRTGRAALAGVGRWLDLGSVRRAAGIASWRRALGQRFGRYRVGVRAGDDVRIALGFLRRGGHLASVPVATVRRLDPSSSITGKKKQAKQVKQVTLFVNDAKVKKVKTRTRVPP